MKPDALPSCFRDRMLHTSSDTASNNATCSKSVQNSATCFYATTVAGQSQIVSITWSKSLMGQGLSVGLDYPAYKQCSVDMKPWRFWKKQGSKSFEMGTKKLEILWDLSSAKYAHGPDPQEGFYVAIICDHEAILLLGDMQKEALKKLLHVQFRAPDATLLSRREHVYGKQLYTTKAKLGQSGRAHDIAIECHAGADKDEPRLSVRVDKQTVIHVTSLMWKFRGNQTIQIDGKAVEVYWDVHNWLFEGEDGHAVFMFSTYMAHEKPQLGEAGVSASIRHHVSTNVDNPHAFSDVLWASVLQWPTSINSRVKEQEFSLLLYAWNNE